jgi:hypothetical protein
VFASGACFIPVVGGGSFPGFQRQRLSIPCLCGRGRRVLFSCLERLARPLKRCEDQLDRVETARDDAQPSAGKDDRESKIQGITLGWRLRFPGEIIGHDRSPALNCS